jgi:hypothetical protein
LALLASSGRLVRARGVPGNPRPGWLPKEDAPPPPEDPIAGLVKLITEAARPGNGRSNRVTVAEIADRLYQADVEITEAEIADVLTRMADVGHARKVQHRGYGSPMSYVLAARLFPWETWDRVSTLASDVCKVMRDHDGVIGYTSPEELAQWLTEAGIQFDEADLPPAIEELTHIGRLQSPRADQWDQPGARPTWYVPPTVHQS